MPRSAKDRLILALGAQLRAERETRQALAAVIGNGQLDPVVLVAILSDPVPAVVPNDVDWLDDVAWADEIGADRIPSPRREAA